MFEKIKAFLFKNTSTKQTVAKNTFWLSVSNFGGRLIKAIIIIYAARVLGTAGYGVFSYAVTLAGFMSLFMDPGVNSVLLRDASKASDEERLSIFSATFFIKVILLVFGVGLIIFIAPSFSTLPGAQALLPAVAIILAFDTLREFLSAFIRVMEKMEWEAGIFIATNFAVVVFGFIFLWISPTALSLAWGYAIGTMLGAIIAVIVMRKYIVRAWSYFSHRHLLPILHAAWPFAIVGALGLLFTNTDILIISWIKTASIVGIYSAAIRIIQVLYIIPAILQLSTISLFSRLAKRDDAKFRLVLERTVSLLFLVSIPMAIGGAILGTSIMSLIYGTAFASGGTAFAILMASMVADFPGSLMANGLFVYERQKNLIITAIVGAVANVGLDLLLIPRYGMTGSAIATLAAQIIGNGLVWYYMKKINYFVVFPHLKRVAVAGICMGLVTAGLYFLHINLILNIVTSIVVYFGLLKLLHEPLLIEMLAVLPFARFGAKTMS